MTGISSARTVADIEFVAEIGRHPNNAAEWHIHGVNCRRDRHRFSAASYEFTIDVTLLSHAGSPQASWQATIVTEWWHSRSAHRDLHRSKWLKVTHGKASDLLASMRRQRTQAIPQPFRSESTQPTRSCHDAGDQGLGCV
jgi:hypothetical protein